ncbi:MAG: nucleotidyltransferase family protein, partial [Lachnospiraceae bacterium]|nr:nucleotidyltransferase family protein [Lachnospiraceae bacterium]
MGSKMKVVIQAGGMGSRLNKVTGGRIPKPLAKLNGKTMLDWQFEQLKRYGFTDIYLIVGYLGEKIKEYYGDGKKAGIKISYIQEEEPLGSAGALYYLKEKIGTKDFILLFGDIIFNIDINKMEIFHKQKGSMSTLFVHPNSHPYDSDLIVLNDDCQIVK